MRNYFESMQFWYVEALGFYLLLRTLFVPANPLSRLTVPLIVAWLIIRFFVARHLSRSK